MCVCVCEWVFFLLFSSFISAQDWWVLCVCVMCVRVCVRKLFACDAGACTKQASYVQCGKYIYIVRPLQLRAVFSMWNAATCGRCINGHTFGWWHRHHPSPESRDTTAKTEPAKLARLFGAVAHTFAPIIGVGMYIMPDKMQCVCNVHDRTERARRAHPHTHTHTQTEWPSTMQSKIDGKGNQSHHARLRAIKSHCFRTLQLFLWLVCVSLLFFGYLLICCYAFNWQRFCCCCCWLLIVCVSFWSEFSSSTFDNVSNVCEINQSIKCHDH